MQVSLSDLLDLAGWWPREKASRTSVRRVTLSLQQRRAMFLATSTEIYSSPVGHIVSVFYPKAGRLERLFQKGSLTPLNQICRVGCSCEAWSYWGAAYKSTQEGYRLPGPHWKENRPPSIRDPHGSYWICKHVIRVGESLVDVSFSQLAAAGGVASPQHAQASLDAIRDVIATSMTQQGGDPSSLSDLRPEEAEETMESLGMLCPVD